MGCCRSPTTTRSSSLPTGKRTTSPARPPRPETRSVGGLTRMILDLALADAVVAQIEQNFCIDTNRIYAHGWSFGGSMSYRTACSRPLGGTGSATWGVRAIAVYSGAQLSGNCTPTAPVAYYGSHGTHDSVLKLRQPGIAHCRRTSPRPTAARGRATKVNSGAHVCTTLTGCKTGYPLEFCSFNGDHTPYPIPVNRKAAGDRQRPGNSSISSSQSPSGGRRRQRARVM